MKSPLPPQLPPALDDVDAASLSTEASLETCRLAISNEQLAMHYQFSISNDELNRQLPIANVSFMANRQSLIKLKGSNLY